MPVIYQWHVACPERSCKNPKQNQKISSHLSNPDPSPLATYTYYDLYQLAPFQWNSSPTHITTASSLEISRARLTTNLFTLFVQCTVYCNHMVSSTPLLITCQLLKYVSFAIVFIVSFVKHVETHVFHKW